MIEDSPGKVNLFAKNRLCDGRKERKLAIFGGAAVVGGQIGRKPWWSSAVYPVRQIWRKHRKASIYLSGQQLILYQTNRKKRENYTKLQTMLNSYLGSGFLEEKDLTEGKGVYHFDRKISVLWRRKGRKIFFCWGNKEQGMKWGDGGVMWRRKINGDVNRQLSDQ